MEEILLMVAEPETETITYNQGKAKHAKSPAIFPKEHIMCDIADTDKICVTCEHELHQIIEYTIKKLDLISTQIKVIGNFHLKYTYKTYKKNGTSNTFKQVFVADSVILKDHATPSLHSQIIANKLNTSLGCRFIVKK